MNIGFPRARAGENAPEPVKLEITVQPVKNDLPDKKDDDKNCECEKDYDKDCECEKDYDKDCECEKDYDKDCECEKDYDKDCECDKDYDKECGKDYEYDEKTKTLKICAENYCKSNVINVKSCDDLVCYDLGDYFFKQNGFILELSIKLKDVCPKRRTALALILYELDKCGKEYIRGFKTVLVPPTGKYVCDDICVNCLRFVVPEALDISGDWDPCGPRKFVVRYTANYVDSDFSVCGCLYKDKEKEKEKD
ncbi:MAG: hypothetical protein ACYCWE_04895 [Eubacteriales bacterium]